MDSCIGVVQIMVLIIIITLVFVMVDGQKSIYKCIDTFGDTVYCERLYRSRDGVYGITDDGTTIKVTQYKKLDRKD